MIDVTVPRFVVFASASHTIAPSENKESGNEPAFIRLSGASTSRRRAIARKMGVGEHRSSISMRRMCGAPQPHATVAAAAPSSCGQTFPLKRPCSLDCCNGISFPAIFGISSASLFESSETSGLPPTRLRKHGATCASDDTYRAGSCWHGAHGVISFSNAVRCSTPDQR